MMKVAQSSNNSPNNITRRCTLSGYIKINELFPRAVLIETAFWQKATTGKNHTKILDPEHTENAVSFDECGDVFC